jgi:hypothetical protein
MESLRTSSAHVLVTSDQLSATGTVVLDSDTEHHLRRVLRLRDGEAVSVTDGAGRWLLTRASIAGPVIRLEPTSKLVTEPARARPITIAVAMPKGDRLDWLVQKVTELGVDRIALLHAERSVVRWKPERTATQLERLRRISDEACRQSRRVWRVTTMNLWRRRPCWRVSSRPSPVGAISLPVTVRSPSDPKAVGRPKSSIRQLSWCLSGRTFFARRLRR